MNKMITEEEYERLSNLVLSISKKNEELMKKEKFHEDNIIKLCVEAQNYQGVIEGLKKELKDFNHMNEIAFNATKEYKLKQEKIKTNLIEELNYWKDYADNSIHKDNGYVPAVINNEETDWQKEAEFLHFKCMEHNENEHHIKHIFNREIEKLNGQLTELKSIKSIMDEYKYKKAYEINKKKLSSALTRLNSIKKICDNEDNEEGNLQEIQFIMENYSGQGDMIIKKYSQNELKLAKLDNIYQTYMLFLENPQSATTHMTAINQYVEEINELLYRP